MATATASQGLPFGSSASGNATNPLLGPLPFGTNSSASSSAPTSYPAGTNPASIPGIQQTNTGIGVNQTSISPGVPETNSTAGASNILAPQPNPTASTSQANLPASLTAPYYNQAATAGNIGTQTGSLMNGATGFLDNLFGTAGSGGQASNYLSGVESNQLSPEAQASLAAGTQSASVLMNQGLAQQNAQFMGTPFSSALPVAQGNIIGQYANNLTQTAANLGLQQEQLGTQAATAQQQMATSQDQFPATATEAAAAVPVTDSQGLQNAEAAAQAQPYSVPLSTYSQEPYLAPTEVSTGATPAKTLL